MLAGRLGRTLGLRHFWTGKTTHAEQFGQTVCLKMLFHRLASIVGVSFPVGSERRSRTNGGLESLTSDGTDQPSASETLPQTRFTTTTCTISLAYIDSPPLAANRSGGELSGQATGYKFQTRGYVPLVTPLHYKNMGTHTFPAKFLIPTICQFHPNSKEAP